MPNSDFSTPLMRQYNSIKERHPNALLLFRLGDFYELFFDDAAVAARELQITLTARNKEKGAAIPMCGVPYHAAEGYIAKLIRKGYRVAICDQMEDPRFAKKLVKREVTRVVTPGTAIDPQVLEPRENNYLAAAVERDGAVGLAFADLSTGDFRATEFAGPESMARFREELVRMAPKEILLCNSGNAGAPPTLVPKGTGRIGSRAGEPALSQANGTPALPGNLKSEISGLKSEMPVMAETRLDEWVFSDEYGSRLLHDHFRVATLDGYGLEGRRLAIAAAGAILHYIRETQRGSLGHLDTIRFYQQQDSLILDPATLRNLELLEPAFGGPRGATLLGALDRCVTSLGARLLKNWILRPSICCQEIEARWDAVAVLAEDSISRQELRRGLAQVQDLERLLSKVTMETANARDLLALANSLKPLPAIRSRLAGVVLGTGGSGLGTRDWGRLVPSSVAPGPESLVPSSSLAPSSLAPSPQSPVPGVVRLAELHGNLDELADVRELLEQSIHPEPPVLLTEGGLIRSGYHAELDELRGLSQNSKRVVAEIEARERERTRITSLKVRFNNIFGYYIEVSKPNLPLVPGDYERKQTLVNAERFTTPELKQWETKILEAEEKTRVLELDLFREIRRRVAAEARRIRQTAAVLAELDVLACFAELAAERSYHRPEFSDDGEMLIVQGRHPVIERMGDDNGSGRFIPNDLAMNPTSDRILIITGPNMGGKSTYLRQAALIALMAQIGCFVPAHRARLPIFDRIFTRIGASDNLARGRSTFMVEMTEAAGILNTATPRSLVLLDEVGRGTATFDGLAIAWAVVEYLETHTRAKTLFATHYHELTELADLLPGVRNYHVSVKESGSSIIFLRKVEPGSADKSYGIEVARLAGLPRRVVERAREILLRHEQSEHTLSERLEAGSERRKSGPVQLTIFTPLNAEIVQALEKADLDNMRPLEALNLLAELKRQIQS